MSTFWLAPLSASLVLFNGFLAFLRHIFSQWQRPFTGLRGMLHTLLFCFLVSLYLLFIFGGRLNDVRNKNDGFWIVKNKAFIDCTNFVKYGGESEFVHCVRNLQDYYWTIFFLYNIADRFSTNEIRSCILIACINHLYVLTNCSWNDITLLRNMVLHAPKSAPKHVLTVTACRLK